MQFLYDKILQEFGRQTLKNTRVPDFVVSNLNKDFEIREYQQEAFARFLKF